MLLRKTITMAAAALLLPVAAMASPSSLIWTIGSEDGSSAEFALDASRLDDFKKNDFFFEDHFFVIGHSDAKVDFPFLQAGINDAFVGGCGNSSTISPQTNIIFGVSRLAKNSSAVLKIALVRANPNEDVRIKVTVNGRPSYYDVKAGSGRRVLEMPLSTADLIRGDNHICIAPLSGSWVEYDCVSLEGNGVTLASKKATERLTKVRSAEYDLNGGPERTFETPADYVDTRIGSGHSRWMLAPGPWMPFSMVKLSPNNQNSGWNGGYQPTIENIACMSHIHEWTMAGLGMLPVNGPLIIKEGDENDPDSGYRSRIDKSTETAPLGYYSVRLTDYDILLEATASTHSSMMRYTYPQDKDGRIMVDFKIPAEYGYDLTRPQITQVSDNCIEGYISQVSPTSSDFVIQDYVIYFSMEFDAPVRKSGHWVDGKVSDGADFLAYGPKDAGFFVEFDTREHPVVQVRTGISFVSLENARENLAEEITKPCGWDFSAVVQAQKDAWNDILGRVEIETSDVKEKVRFYTNLYHSMTRNTFSDVNGEWRDPSEAVRKLDDPVNDRALGCDAFWNSMWNLNQVWNLVTPEWASRWVRSQIDLYKYCGFLSKGPAGMEYIPVMEAQHEIPLMVAAWQMGIRDFDAELALKAMIHQVNSPLTPVCGGWEGNEDLGVYLKYHYVPCTVGRCSNTFEYSYDDWTVGQFAKALGHEDIYKEYNERGGWWRNGINPANGCAHLRDVNGKFVDDFDPLGNYSEYTESNGWQIGFFVPQDVEGLASYVGRDKFIEKLDWGFNQSYPVRFNAPGDNFSQYPVVQGNQQSMQLAFLFNRVGRPDLTQKWTRAILDRYYGYGVANAWLGDEDQGQMSAWFVMAAMGLFQIDGGCSVDPVYEIVSPLYPRTTIHLGGRYGRGQDFVIEAHNSSADNVYVQKAVLNGRELSEMRIPASELLKGGKLELWMAPEQR